MSISFFVFEWFFLSFRIEGFLVDLFVVKPVIVSTGLDIVKLLKPGSVLSL
jgi:hypothetical protein